MSKVTFSITMEEGKKGLLKRIGEGNYRSVSDEVNFAVDFYLNHLNAISGTFVQLNAGMQLQQVWGENNAPAQEIKQDNNSNHVTIESFGDDEVDDL